MENEEQQENLADVLKLKNDGVRNIEGGDDIIDKLPSMYWLAKAWWSLGNPDDFFEDEAVKKAVFTEGRKAELIDPDVPLDEVTLVFVFCKLLEIDEKELFFFLHLGEKERSGLVSCVKPIDEFRRIVMERNEEIEKIVMRLEELKRRRDGFVQSYVSSKGKFLRTVQALEAKGERLRDFNAHKALFVSLRDFFWDFEKKRGTPITPEAKLVFLWVVFGVKDIEARALFERGLEDKEEKAPKKTPWEWLTQDWKEILPTSFLKREHDSQVEKIGVLAIPYLLEIGQSFHFDRLAEKIPKDITEEEKEDLFGLIREAVDQIDEYWVIEKNFGASREEVDRFNRTGDRIKEGGYERYLMLFDFPESKFGIKSRPRQEDIKKRIEESGLFSVPDTMITAEDGLEMLDPSLRDATDLDSSDSGSDGIPIDLFLDPEEDGLDF